MDQETCKIRWKCKECSNKDFASKQTAVNHANKYHGDSDPGLIIVKVSKSIHLKAPASKNKKKAYNHFSQLSNVFNSDHFVEDFSWSSTFKNGSELSQREKVPSHGLDSGACRPGLPTVSSSPLVRVACPSSVTAASSILVTSAASQGVHTAASASQGVYTEDTAASRGVYIAASQGVYTAASQGVYTAATQGLYTAASHGEYIAASHGGNTVPTIGLYNTAAPSQQVLTLASLGGLISDSTEVFTAAMKGVLTSASPGGLKPANHEVFTPANPEVFTPGGREVSSTARQGVFTAAKPPLVTKVNHAVISICGTSATSLSLCESGFRPAPSILTHTDVAVLPDDDQEDILNLTLNTSGPDINFHHDSNPLTTFLFGDYEKQTENSALSTSLNTSQLTSTNDESASVMLSSKSTFKVPFKTLGHCGNVDCDGCNRAPCGLCYNCQNKEKSR